MKPRVVEKIIEKALQLWPAQASLEITLEANPTSVEAQKFQDFKAAGINRVSIGIQALDQEALAFLGREHSVNEAEKALDIASHLFNRYSFDLIYGRPGQTLASWKQELSLALSYVGDHLSLYQLTIEPGTIFYQRFKKGDLQPLDDNLLADLYDVTEEALNKVGMAAYEISNYASSGGECQHNLRYWRYQEYAGVGPGAHGRLSMNGEKVATREIRAPLIWLEKVENDPPKVIETQHLTPQEKGAEALMMGLRLLEGITKDTFKKETNCELDSLLEASVLDKLCQDGFLINTPSSLKATTQGRRCLNSVLQRLL